MTRHESFEEIFKACIDAYGNQAGTKIYDSFFYNNSLDETIAYKPQTVDVSMDAIQGNYDQIQRSLNDFFLSEQEKYALIIDKYMTEGFNSGIQTVAKELSLQPNELIDFDRPNAVTNVLKENAKTLNFNLLDSIRKDTTLLLTNIDLNDIPISNTKLKQEVQSIFAKRAGQLQSQIVTETDRAFNTGLDFGYKESGVVTHKMWVAVVDDRTTSICRQLNGEIVEIGQPFSGGIYTAPAHINCRSRVVGLTISESGEYIRSDNNQAV